MHAHQQLTAMSQWWLLAGPGHQHLPALMASGLWWRSQASKLLPAYLLPTQATSMQPLAWMATDPSPSDHLGTSSTDLIRGASSSSQASGKPSSSSTSLQRFALQYGPSWQGPLSASAVLSPAPVHRHFSSTKSGGRSLHGGGSESDDDEGLHQPGNSQPQGFYARRGSSQDVMAHVMRDPISRVMASRGIPLGVSLDSFKPGAKVDELSDEDDQHTATSSSSSSTTITSTSEASIPTSNEGPYAMEALDDIFLMTKAKALPAHLQAAAAAAETPSTPSTSGSGAHPDASTTMHASSSGLSGNGGQGAAGAGGAGGGAGGSAGGSGDGRGKGRPGDDAAAEQYVAGDAWGTTKESPAEIARRLVQSNADADAAGESHAGLDAAYEPLPSEEPLEDVLAPGQEKYKTLEQMSSDIKALDEVFEVLAQVPWLDECDLQQKELKGVAMVGLLGTLEEVGFNIRHQVERIWAGEHDEGIILECEVAKDQAALISILFHTKNLKDEYGAPVAYLPAPVSRGAGSGSAERVSASLVSDLLSMHGKQDKNKA